MNTELEMNEIIHVVAVFGSGLHPCRPIKFKRSNGVEVTIVEIGLVHPTLKGRRTVHMFDVTDGQSDYRIMFDSETLIWRLTRMGDGI